MRTVFLALLAAVLISSPGRADDRDFVVVNASGYAMKFLGVNPPGDETWNENELDGLLPDGYKIKVKFSDSDKGCRWNVKVTWADDNTSSIFRNVDLCKIEVMTIRYDKAADRVSYTTQ